MYTIDQTEAFERTAQKFFKKHRDLLPRLGEVIEMLQADPFLLLLKCTSSKGSFPNITPADLRMNTVLF